MRAKVVSAPGYPAGRMSAGQPTLGIIAGGGRLPAQLAESCEAMQRPYFVIAFEGYANLGDLRHAPHAVVRLGAVGEALSHLRQAGATEVVLAGSIRRPSFATLRPDLTGARLLARLSAAFFSGDDALLRAVVRFLEDEGFRVIGVSDVISALLAGEGVLGKIRPDAHAKKDIARGLEVVRALGALDIGQAAIVENGFVLGVEAAEGTDALIARCAALKRETKAGVLVKARKSGQEMRADLPAIGPGTVETLAEYGFSGIALEAGGGIILDKDMTISKADALGLFIVGVRHG